MNPEGKSQQLLNQLESKRLNLSEFLTECAYWYVKEGFDELKPRILPTKPPKAIEMDLKYKNEKADWGQIYEDYPEVKGYHGLYRQVVDWNKSTKEWLTEMLSYIPEGDYPTRIKIKDRLRMFDETQDK